jgi:hypothetical protein
MLIDSLACCFTVKQRPSLVFNCYASIRFTQCFEVVYRCSQVAAIVRSEEKAADLQRALEAKYGARIKGRFLPLVADALDPKQVRQLLCG